MGTLVGELTSHTPPAGMAGEEQVYEDFEDDDTLSMDLQYAEVVVQYGRVYQRYALEENLYYVPADPDEDERMTIQHHVITRFLEGNLIHAPIQADPKNVLDCGYGQGDWALSVAARYPDCEVTGIDIRPLDLLDIPHNLNLECEDLNCNLAEVYPINHYDLIQSRFISNGIHRDGWASYMSQLKHLLKPGGWLQMIEFYYNFQSHSGLLNASHALFEWGSLFRNASERLNRCPRVGSMTNLKEMMERARLCSIHYRNCSIPIGGWSRDAKEREIGTENVRNIERMLDSLGTWPFCHVLNMKLEDVVALCSRAKQELRDNNLKLYLPMTLCYGQRPLYG